MGFLREAEDKIDQERKRKQDEEMYRWKEREVFRKHPPIDFKERQFPKKLIITND